MQLISLFHPRTQSLGEVFRRADSPTLNAVVDGGGPSMGMILVGVLVFALFLALPVVIATLRGQHQYLVSITLGSLLATVLTFSVVGLPPGLLLYAALIAIAFSPRLAQKVLR